jgi:hypothetical protein
MRSSVVKKQEFVNTFAWAKRQNFWGRWMPESYDSHEIFLGEYYWSPAYFDILEASRGDRAWNHESRAQKNLPAPLVVLSHSYFAEGNGYDCSLDDSIRIRIPAPWLGEQLGARWAGREGEFVDASGQVVARDPSAQQSGPGVLLLRESVLADFLASHEYEIIWTVLGGKHVLGRRATYRSPGEMQISGAYGRADGFAGQLNTTFVPFPPRA